MRAHASRLMISGGKRAVEMETAEKIMPLDAQAPNDLIERKRRNAAEKLAICFDAIAAVQTADSGSWQRIINEMLEGGFSEAELERELAASRNTIYKWRSGLAAPREMTRRLLQKAVLEMVQERMAAVA